MATLVQQPGDLLFADPPAVDSRLIFGAGAGSAWGAGGATTAQPGDLLFADPAAVDGRLIFGLHTLSPAGAPTDLAFSAALGAPAAAFALQPRVWARMVAALAPPGLSAGLLFDSRTQRPTVGTAAQPWQVAQPLQDGFMGRHRDAQAHSVDWKSLHQGARSSPEPIVHRLPQVLFAQVLPYSSSMQGACGLQSQALWPTHDALRNPAAHRSGFEAAARIEGSSVMAHQDADHSRRAQQVARWQSAVAQVLREWAGFEGARAAPQAWVSRFEGAVVPPPGRSVLGGASPPAHPPLCPNGPYQPSSALLFAALAGSGSSAALVYACEGVVIAPPTEPVALPIRRVYFVINDVRLERAADGAPLPLHSLSLSLDASSWTWGFDALLPASAQALLVSGNGGPLELVASVNGTAFHVLAESISRERSFGDASIRISGRGRNAVLAAPYAPVMSFTHSQARTARQLMDDVLTRNGVSLGWGIDWGLTDWNVPAGVFAHQGTWIEALSAIAGAAGGYLLPHPFAQTIGVRHSFPVAPWAWNTVTPDFVLPVDAVSRESLRWVDKPSYNRVFVSGQDSGVLAQVTRAGTAGDVLAPMVVDALITDAAAARQRGLAVLADTGAQFEMSLRLPLLAETGVIAPGAFVSYQDGAVSRLGLVRSTRLDASWPEVWQTIGVQGYA